VTERPSLDDPEVYRMLVEGIPAIVYVDEPDELSTNFYTSPQAVELLGYTQEEWASTPDLWVTHMHPDDVDRVLEENRRSNRDLDRFFCEYRMLAKDGRLVWLRDEATIVSDDDGTPLYWRGLMLDITAEKEAEEKLRRSMDALRRTIQQRRELAVRLEGAQEEERRRIAADIHDDPIQVMSAVDLRLQTLAADPSEVTSRELNELHSTVQLSIERLRSMVFELRPLALDTQGLLVAVRDYLEHAADVAGWVVGLQDRLANEPDDDLRATLYRIVQEAVGNARKHAEAARVDVSVATVGDGILVQIHDDGRGFDPEGMDRPRPGHIGLATIHERSELAGGWCRVRSRVGEGTTIECWLPVDSPAGGS
jgi:PAS domain S-box-containing protein